MAESMETQAWLHHFP